MHGIYYKAPEVCKCVCSCAPGIGLPKFAVKKHTRPPKTQLARGQRPGEPRKRDFCFSVRIYIYIYLRKYHTAASTHVARISASESCATHIVDELVAISKNACSIITVSWVSILIVGRIYDFHVAYISFIERTKSEEWLFEHCQDDHFFHKMAFYTDVCAMVVGNSIIWPSLYGINESMSKMKLCGFYACTELLRIIYSGGIPIMFCIVLLYIVTPSFILPLLQRMYYAYCEKQLMTKFSPILRRSNPSSDTKHDRKHDLYYDLMDTDTSNFQAWSAPTRFA